MKITVTINLNGQVFTIDEDIEARIAELLKERITTSKQSITIDDIENVITIMGKPKDFGPSSNSNESNNQDTIKNYRFNRRLYRDPDNRIIGGVASGIGAWLNVDPVIVRVFFVLSFFAVGPLLYIILWIIIPLARTSAQKLEMIGQDITIENIERVIKDEFREVKESLKNLKKKDTLDKIESEFSSLIYGVSRILSVIGKIIATIILIALVVGLVAFLMVASNLFPLDAFSYHINWGQDEIGPLKMIFNTFISPSNANLLSWGIILFVGAIFLSLIIGLGRAITGVKRGFWFIHSILFITWMAGLGCIIGATLSEGSHFNKSSSQKFVKTLDLKASDTLKIKITDPILDENTEFKCGDFDDIGNFSFHSEGCFVQCINGKLSYHAQPKFDITPSSNLACIATIEKKATGANTNEALASANDISYKWKYEETTLDLSETFSVENTKWRNPRIKVQLSIPLGKKVLFVNSAEYFKGNFANQRVYTVKADGLE